MSHHFSSFAHNDDYGGIDWLRAGRLLLLLPLPVMIAATGLVRATPTGVAIRGVIPVTAKMAPKSPKTMLQQRWHRRWQNAIHGVGVPYLATLERDAGGCKIVVDGSCASQQLSQRLYSI